MRQIINNICVIILFIWSICIFTTPSLFNINDYEDGGLLILILAFMIFINNKIDNINEKIDNLF